MTRHGLSIVRDMSYGRDWAASGVWRLEDRQGEDLGLRLHRSGSLGWVVDEASDASVNGRAVASQLDNYAAPTRLGLIERIVFVRRSLGLE